MVKPDQEKWSKSLEKYLKNPSWKERYENAPSKECKDYWAYTFYYSAYFDPNAEDASDFEELKNYYYDRLSVEDWKYIRDNIGNSPFVVYINQRIKELSK